MCPNYCLNEIEKTSFEFICPFCFNPWYQDIVTKDDVCVNENCSIFDKSLGIKPPRMSVDVKVESERRQLEIIAKLMAFDSKFLSRYFYEARRSMISDYHERRAGLNIDRFFALNELLLELNLHTPIGASTDPSKAEELVTLYTEFARQRNMLDDILTLRYYLGPGGKEVYGIKYWYAFNQMLENYGIINRKKFDSTALFKYLDVDTQTIRNLHTAKPAKPVDTAKPVDLIEYFKNTYLESIRLRLFFGLHGRTSRLFGYTPHLADLATLSALFFSIGQTTESWPLERLQHLFEINVPPTDNRRFSDFQDQIIDSKDSSPIIVREGANFYVDRNTILFFLHYLVGHNVGAPKGKKLQIVADKKNESAVSFEGKIRDELTKKGYCTPSSSIRAGGHQYDVIAVKEDRRRVLIIEAKYKDFSPSSISGKNLLSHEVYDEQEGLLTEAITQLVRFEFFVSHPQGFLQRVQFKQPIKDYEACAFIVTKYLPLISKYRTIRICSFDDFLEKYA